MRVILNPDGKKKGSSRWDVAIVMDKSRSKVDEKSLKFV
jgi:hypothetical protein